eukprot:c20910_g1_i5 orf=288-536(+)
MTMMGPNLFVQLAIWTLAFYFLFLGADRTFYRKADVAPNTSRVAWHAVLFCSILQATVKVVSNDMGCWVVLNSYFLHGGICP